MQAALAMNQDDVLARLDELPSLPTIVYELNRVINDPMSSTADVERLMATDQSLAARVLRVVNSAYFAIPGGVSSLTRAIAYLGFDTINQIVLCASVMNVLEVKSAPEFDLKEFWKHALGVGIVAETIAKYVRHPTPADLFTCGLIHDMGKVALYTIAPETMTAVIETCRLQDCTFLQAESKLELSSKHTDLGAMLAQRWRLPPGLQAVIREHHTQAPSLREGELTHQIHRNVDIVLLANLFTHALKFGHSGHDQIPGAPTEVLARLGLDGEPDFKACLQEVDASLARAIDFLDFFGGDSAGANKYGGDA